MNAMFWPSALWPSAISHPPSAIRYQPEPSMPSSLNRLLSSVVIAALLISGSGCGPPQVVADEECFSAVDALWTAVTSKRIDLVEQTATELNRLQAKGSLSNEGHAALTKVVDMARAAEWQPAAETLKGFMLGQRRVE